MAGVKGTERSKRIRDDQAECRGQAIHVQEGFWVRRSRSHPPQTGSPRPGANLRFGRNIEGLEVFRVVSDAFSVPDVASCVTNASLNVGVGVIVQLQGREG